VKDQDRIDHLVEIIQAPNVDIDKLEAIMQEFGLTSAEGIQASTTICNALLPGYLFKIDNKATETAQIQEHVKKVTAVSAVLSLYPKCKFVVAAMWDAMFVQKMLAAYPHDKRMQDTIKLERVKDLF